MGGGRRASCIIVLWPSLGEEGRRGLLKQAGVAHLMWREREICRGLGKMVWCICYEEGRRD